MGGLSSERPVSFKSGRAVLKALQERGWDAVGIDVGRDLAKQLVEQRIDAAFIALHGKFGEDGCVQGMLEVMGIPYTGCGVRASAVAMDKITTKSAVRHLQNVVMAGDAVFRKGQLWDDELRLPVVCKPAVGGSTIGMSLCKTREAIQDGLVAAFTLNDDVLVEEFVAGDEITVAVLDGEVMPVVRIVPESGFFDFEAKYTEGKTVYEVPAPIDDGVREAAQAAAAAVYEVLGCRGLCRADFIVREDGVPVFLEINTIPGMTATSLSPMAAGAAGIPFPELVERILLSATYLAPEVSPSGA
ncbi:MAG: D-alanine--D-alanine ligase [Rhodobacterales bacterium]|nr:D-alanine--D-alanine ligase [Rhodobacterales bacterium]